MDLGRLVLGFPVHYRQGHEENDVPTFWLLLSLTLSPKPSGFNPKPETLNPKPSTLNPEP